MVSDDFYDVLMADVLHNQADIGIAEYKTLRRYYHKLLECCEFGV